MYEAYIFNISGIAVAVNKRNVTFGNNVSTVFEMSAIHEVSHLQPSLELLVSTPCVNHHKVFYFMLQLRRSCHVVQDMSLPFYSSTISDNVVEMSILVPFQH